MPMSGYPGRVACLDSESRIAEIVSTVRKTDGMQRGGSTSTRKLTAYFSPCTEKCPSPVGEVRVADDGHGLPFEGIATAFGSLGGSATAASPSPADPAVW